MKNRVTALALSIILCGSTVLPGISLAANKPILLKEPTLKTTISQNNSQVELTMGKAQIIHLSVPASRVSISNPEVVGIVLISPTEVELIGKSTGVANLLVWSEATGPNTLTIDLSVHRDVSTLANKIQMIDPGINILPVGAEDSVILTGVAESMEKAQLAYDLAKAFFSDDKAGGAPGGGETSSNSPGSNTFAETSTKIINLIRVMGQPTTKAEMVQEQLKDIDAGIKLNVVPGFGGKEKAILTGRVRNASMVAKAVNLTSVFYGTPGIKLLNGPGGNVVKEGKETEDSTSFEAGSGGGLIGNLAGNVLHGSVITDTSGNVVSMLEVEERPQVKCSIKFLEVQKSAATLLNASSRVFSDHVNASTYAGRHGKFTNLSGQQVLITDINNFVGQVNGNDLGEVAIRYGRDFATLISGLVTGGQARVLAEPNITSISGEPASFLAGGEFPIPVINSNGGTSILFKEFGIRLNVLATVTDRGTIHMQVSPEVSSLDPTAGININGFLIPGLRTRRSQTVLEMKDGDNFVLSGLYNQDMTDNYSKTPILGQIPILGNLFRSKDYQNRQTEMVIVIHPEIQSDMDMSNLPTATKVSTTEAPSNAAPKLDPDEVFKEFQALRDDQKGNQSEKTIPTIPATSANPISQPDPKVEAAKALPTEGKSPKEIAKEVKKAEKEARRLSRQMNTGLAQTADKKQADATEAKAGPSASATASSEKQSTIFMAQPVIPTILPKGSLSDYLIKQQEELTQLLHNLEQQVVEIPATPMIIAPAPEKKSSPVESVPPKQMAKPVEKQKEVMLPLPAIKPTEIKATAAIVKSPTALKKAVVEAKTIAAKPVAKVAVNPTATQRFVDHNVKMIQRGLSQLLSFNGF